MKIPHEIYGKGVHTLIGAIYNLGTLLSQQINAIISSLNLSKLPKPSLAQALEKSLEGNVFLFSEHGACYYLSVTGRYTLGYLR